MKTVTFDESKFALVPAWPTEEMLTAARQAPIPRLMVDSYSAEQNLTNGARYRAMLAAAPESPPLTVTVDPDPRGVSVGVYQGSSCVYHGAHPIPAGSVADEGAEDERSDTYGMNLGERIAHVGGRTNAQGYTEFGSPMAVNALIQHVLRDIDWTRQADDGAYQARYRLPSGQWSSWGHVVCGVKGHEQELRYLPGARRPAPAAGDAQIARQLLPKLQSLLDRMANDPHTGTMFEADGDTLRDAMHLCRSVVVAAASQQGGE